MAQVNVREEIRKRIDAYEKYLKLIDHKTQGMEKKGWYDEDGTYQKFTQEEIKAARELCEDMLDFYDELLEQNE